MNVPQVWGVYYLSDSWRILIYCSISNRSDETLGRQRNTDKQKIKKKKKRYIKLTHSTKKPVTTMLTYPWKCTVLHCNHLGNTWKPLVLMTRNFDYCPSASEGDNQSVGSSAPVVSRCFPGGYNVKLYISRGRLGWWLLAFCTVTLLGHQRIIHCCNLVTI